MPESGQGSDNSPPSLTWDTLWRGIFEIRCQRRSRTPISCNGNSVASTHDVSKAFSMSTKATNVTASRPPCRLSLCHCSAMSVCQKATTLLCHARTSCGIRCSTLPTTGAPGLSSTASANHWSGVTCHVALFLFLVLRSDEHGNVASSQLAHADGISLATLEGHVLFTPRRHLHHVSPRHPRHGGSGAPSSGGRGLEPLTQTRSQWRQPSRRTGAVRHLP